MGSDDHAELVRPRGANPRCRQAHDQQPVCAAAEEVAVLDGLVRRIRLLRPLGLLALLALSLSLLWTASRPDPTTGQEQAGRLAGALDADHVLEQTFLARRDGLSAVEVFARIPPGWLDSRYALVLRLREAGSPADLAVLRLPLVSAQQRSRVRFAFPALPDSAGKTYLLRVESDAPPDTVSLAASVEDTYPDGELRLDGEAAARDLVFRTSTALTPLALAHDLSGSAREYAFLLLLTLLAAGVGAALLFALDCWPGDGLAERGLWMVGCGLALAMLAFLVMGVSAGWGIAAVAGLAVLRLVLRLRRGNALIPANRHPAARHPATTALDGALLAVFLWALAVRVLQVCDVPAPMWMDGLSHWQMARSIEDAGRMPGGLLYHIGFHSLVVLLRGWFDLPLERLIVLAGQWVSALNGPALYVLARRLYPRSRTPALLAALLLACLPSLPGYLVNWGRYPFLLGLTLLPFTLAASVYALHHPPNRTGWSRWLLLGTLLVGQFLSHYGTVIFWFSFCAVYLMVERPEWLRALRLRQALPALLTGAAVLLALALLLGSLRFGDDLASKLGETIAQSRQASSELSYNDIVQLNLRSGGLWLAAAGLAGAAWAGCKARRVLALTAGWFAFQAALTAVQSPLLGYALASYANLLLALPLPLALLGGGLFNELLGADEGGDQLPRMVGPKPGTGAAQRMVGVTLQIKTSKPQAAAAAKAAVYLVIALFAFAGGLSQVGILNPAALLYSPADAQAAAWICANTPPTARFLINSGAWAGKTVPSDGGGWLPAVSGREVVFLENASREESLWATVAEKEVQYIYLGRFGGFLARSDFEADPGRYDPVYQEGGVVIYRVTGE